MPHSPLIPETFQKNWVSGPLTWSSRLARKYLNFSWFILYCSLVISHTYWLTLHILGMTLIDFSDRSPTCSIINNILYYVDLCSIIDMRTSFCFLALTTLLGALNLVRLFEVRYINMARSFAFNKLDWGDIDNHNNTDYKIDTLYFFI